MSSVILDIIKELVFRNRDRRANPVWMVPCARIRGSKNALWSARRLKSLTTSPSLSTVRPTLPPADKLVRFDNNDFARPIVAAEFDGSATGLAAHPEAELSCASPATASLLSMVPTAGGC